MSERKKLTHSAAAKVIFVIIYLISAAVGALGTVGAIAMWGTDIYSHGEDYYISGIISGMMRNDANQIVFDTLVTIGRNPELSDAQATAQSGFSPDHTNFYCDVYDADGNLLFQSDTSRPAYKYNAQFGVAVPPTFSDRNGFSYSNDFDGNNYTGGNMRFLTVKCYIREDMSAHDRYYYCENVLSFAYSMRYAIYGICGAAVLLMLASYIFLMCAAGHSSSDENIKLTFADKIPFDLMLFLALCASCVVAVSSEISSQLITLAFAAAYLLLVAMLVLAVSCSFAARVKAGGWWKNNVIYMCLALIWRFTRFICGLLMRGLRFIRGIFRELFANIPLVWQVIGAFAALSLFELIMLGMFWSRPDTLIILFIIGRIILTALLGILVIWMRRLEDGARRLRGGEISYKIDTKNMYGPFLSHAENLNGISEGLNIAVSDKMKSERLKTELITNVSHDIKTPLTSIINYVDLIKKENITTEPLCGYIDVLDRQSARLKKLICDLVEASKASTGNVAVELETLDLAVSLMQAAGEYDERFTEVPLTLVMRGISDGGQRMLITADGRLLWRIFDNLFGNIVKYALAGTRVYIDTSISTDGSRAVVSFKNISREPLSITPDELSERFVRGDSSRHTEGSGLGLAITKSLCELMGGSLKLSCDGDLFKADITLKIADDIKTDKTDNDMSKIDVIV